VVLYRAHFHAMELQMALTRGRIQHVVTSGIRFFEQAHIKDVLSLLRILTTPGDALAFDRLLGMLPGIGPATAKRLWKKLGGKFDTLDTASRRLLLESLTRKEAHERWERIDPILGEFHAEGLRAKGGKVIKDFVEQFYDTYAVDNFENSDARLDDIHELALHFDKFDTIEESLSDIALLTNLDAEAEALRSSSDDVVKLSTIHQAKGLEWPVVIVIWAAEGMFPSARSVRDSVDGEAEERRLFYVAATRAEDELVLCVPEVRRMRDGGVVFCQPSRFVEELDPGIVSERRIGYI
jgi:DNA helicase-2/ATP-dependent DNA helicase PcrA